MMILALTEHIGSWWNELTVAKQLFYGIGLISAFLSVLLTILGVIGMDHHDVDGFHATDVHGASAMSIKPITGFFLGFGWAGGIALDNGLSLFAAVGVALVSGFAVMGVILAMLRAIYSMKSDGTMQVKGAVGAVGTVYITIPARKGAGGQVVVNFSGRQETFSALSGAESPIASGEKVKIVSIIDGRTVLVESL
jgi:hypothetical protein